MEEALALAAARGGGLIFTADLVEFGIDSHAAVRALRRGLLVRVRHGAFALAPQWNELRADARHRLLVRATYALSAERPIVSHLSAAVMHRLPLIGRWPSRVHALAPGAPGGSSRPGFVTHRAAVPSAFDVIDGVRVTPIARTLLNVAMTNSFLIAVAMVDDALRKHGRAASAGSHHPASLTKGMLRDELDRVDPRYGGKAARAAFGFADARSGSPGESLSRVRMYELGFEAPDLQVLVTTARGKSYDVDFGWEGARKFGEFDGYAKYTRAEFLAGRTSAEVLFAEKRREDEIRSATGRSFVRWVWEEALDARVFFRKLEDAGVPRIGARRHVA